MTFRMDNTNAKFEINDEDITFSVGNRNSDDDDYDDLTIFTETYDCYEYYYTNYDGRIAKTIEGECYD